MNIQEIKQAILEGLRPFAEANGFTIDENRFGIFRENPDHTSSIDFLCYTSANGAEIYPYVNIEFPVIHDICSQCGFYLNYTAYMNMFVLEIIKAYNYPAHIDTQPEWLKKFVWHRDLETKMSFACGNKLTILSDADECKRLRKEYKDAKEQIIHTDSGWIKKCNRRIGALLPYALDYIGDLGSMESIDQLYNGRPITWNPSDTSREAGCIVGLIAAKLAHNPRYDEIKDTNFSIMTTDRLTINEDIRQSFFRVADYLDGM